MRHISPEELIALHDANISRYGGLPGMSDPGRAEAIIGRVQARVAYEEITDLFEVSATYLVATARGHIFNDANKRTALNSALLFLRRNGVQVFDSPELADLTVGNKLSREALKMLLDGVSRREVKQYLVGKQVGVRTAIAVLCRQEMVVLKQRMPGSR